MKLSGAWNRSLCWGIRLWQLVAFLLFYLFFAFQYWLAIWYTTNKMENRWLEALIDYFLLKLLLTIPLWWLYFVKWKRRTLIFRLSMHFFTAPLWVFAWFNSYRWIQDWRGGAYLKGNGSWWDIYIPLLVYCLQFAVFHVYDFYLENEYRKKKEKELLELAYDSELNALKAQIQPHFLFNTLNSISASVPLEMEHTRELIAKLADTFRYSLHASEQEWICLSEEINFIRILLELEKERLKKRLEIVIEVDEHLLSTRIPPMLLQPIVENAIRHGIEPSITGGTISIRIRQQNQFVNICISDTGAGLQNATFDMLFNKGIGLRNTNLRMEKLFGEKVIVAPNHPGGLQFILNIPIT